MSTLECNYIVQAYTVLEGLLQSAEKEENQSLPKRYLEHLYIFSIMWSVGALYELDDRAKLEAFMREKTDLDLPSCDPSSGDTIFEFFVDGKGEWRHWSTKVEEYLYPKDSIPVYATILVPNVDNVRTDFLIHTVAKQEKVCTPTTTPTTTSIATPIIMLVFTSTTTPTATPTTTTHYHTHSHTHTPLLQAVLLIGEQGTAKTVIIQGYMSKYNIEEHLSKGLNFSSATQPGHFQVTISLPGNAMVMFTFVCNFSSCVEGH